MASTDIRDFNIRGVGHPKYKTDRIYEDRTMEFIIQKLENCLFTNKGDVLGDTDFGCSLKYYLWSTTVPTNKMRTEIQHQIDTYIPELNNFEYTISLDLYEGTVRDVMYVNIKIKDKSFSFVFS
jgi:hypothetical protein